MKSLSSILVLLIWSVLIANPLFADDFCNIPYLHPFGYGAYYDGRYAVENFPAPHPNGGWKLFIDFKVEDDKGRLVADRIKSVTFINEKTGFEAIVTKPFIDLSYPLMEYMICLGNKENLIGKWEMIIKMKDGKYSKQYEITEEMMDLPRPSVAEDLVIEEYNETEYIVRHAAVNGPYGYRLRIFDDQQTRIFQVDGTYDSSTKDINYIIPRLDGKEARIEFRYYYPAPSQIPVYCYGSDVYMIRSCLHFIVNPYPTYLDDSQSSE